MNKSLWFAIGLALVILLLTGCSARSLTPPPNGGLSESCRVAFAAWQAAATQEQSLDAQAHTPPGFPYLRINRFLASYELDDLTAAERHAWLARAHAEAVLGWRFERQGRALSAAPTLADLEACSAPALIALAHRPVLWAHLQQVASVPDSYRTVSQVLGGYPVVVPVVRWRASVTMGELADRYGRYRLRSGWRNYQPAPFDQAREAAGSALPTIPRTDSLGIPMVAEAELGALIRRHAPGFRIDTRDQHDLPGTPGRSDPNTLLFQPGPVVYVQPGYARLANRVLLQLTYLVWFSARPPEHRFDIYAGALDGFLWRVTLDERGEALIYDTVHACGCYHQWVLVDGGLVLKPSANPEKEQLWILDTVAGRSGGLELSLSAGDHQLVAVAVSGRSLSRGHIERYRIEPLDRLRGAGIGGARLYGPDGLIEGTERLERFLLWPTGVVSAGAMRQWGHHAVSFVGRRHFDDPFLLDRYFFLPR